MTEAPKRGFPEAEFAARTRRAQARMEAAGLSGMLLTDEAELRYFSGFQTLFWQSPTRPWFLFVPPSGQPVAIIPEIGLPLMRTTWLQDIRCWSAPHPTDDGLSLLTELLAPLARQGARIGLMKGPESRLRMPLGDFERLCAALPGLQIGDASPILRALRMVKSAPEIEKIAHICAIAGRSFARVPALVDAGMPLEEVFRAFRREVLAQGADDIPYLVGGADQGGYADVISPPTRRPLRAGDVLMLDTGATWDGYFCDFDRNFAVRRADDAARRAHETLWRATEAGLAAARPGVRCCDLFQAMRDVIVKSGGGDGNVGRLGHGLGMQLTEWPSLAAFDETLIEENMVLTLEPSLGLGAGLMMVHEENIVIRATGPELLSPRTAPELPSVTGAA